MKHTGISLIATERQRQIHEEGFTSKHDAKLKDGILADAACCYILTRHYSIQRLSESFPLDSEMWKPTPNDRIRELTKAGALIAAEIDKELKKKKG